MVSLLGKSSWEKVLGKLEIAACPVGLAVALTAGKYQGVVMVPSVRLERTTYRLGGGCSIP